MAEQTSFVTKFAMLGILSMGLFAAWKGLSTLPTQIADLPVKGTQTVLQQRLEQPAKPEALKALAPLLVPKSPTNLSSQKANENETTADKAFINKAFSVENINSKSMEKMLPNLPTEALPVVDGFESLKYTLRVTALLSDGAVINGQYYHKGEVLTNHAYVNSAAKLITPLLLEVGDVSITIGEPNSKRRVQLPLS